MASSISRTVKNPPLHRRAPQCSVGSLQHFKAVIFVKPNVQADAIETLSFLNRDLQASINTTVEKVQN